MAAEQGVVHQGLAEADGRLGRERDPVDGPGEFDQDESILTVGRDPKPEGDVLLGYGRMTGPDQDGPGIEEGPQGFGQAAVERRHGQASPSPSSSPSASLSAGSNSSPVRPAGTGRPLPF